MPGPGPGPRRRAPFRPLANERGLTLTELTVVGVIATLVMVGLTVFYYNSQSAWIDGSTQALAQRDATMLVDALSRRVHEADSAGVAQTGPFTDLQHHRLLLFYRDGHMAEFRWNDIDRRLHLWLGTAS